MTNFAVCSLLSDLREDASWISGTAAVKAPTKQHTLVHAAFSSLWSMLKLPIGPYQAPLKRQLQQSGQTYQATLTLSLSFTSQPSGTAKVGAITADLSTALQQATQPLMAVSTIISDTAGANLILNASVLYPPGNSVSTSPSQATLSAVSLTNSLQQNLSQALPGLEAKDGPVQVVFISLTDTLVPTGSTASQQSSPANSLQSPTPPSPVPTVVTTTPVTTPSTITSSSSSSSSQATVQVPDQTIQATPEPLPALAPMVSSTSPEVCRTQPLTVPARSLPSASGQFLCSWKFKA